VEKGPSRTAVRTAIHRAAHLLLDGNPKILTDTFAGAFAGYASDADLLRALETLKLFEPRMRAVVTVRNRYAEDELADAFRRGVTQYVILGAGLDSFAYRRSEPMASVQVVEIDHPASQAWKRARIAELGIAPPSRLHHLPIDFERQTLGEGLAAGGLDLKIPVFFAVLGVAQYLTKGALSQMLRDIAETTAPGSELVMQFVAPLESLETSDAALAYALANRAIESGERWLGFYEPAEMERHLREAGFGAISQFGRELASERYLRNRTDGLTLPGYFQMIKAQVR
jgi:methyltransferase (TIGR00027 family)